MQTTAETFAAAIVCRLCAAGYAAAWVDGERWEFYATDNGAEIVGPSILETAENAEELAGLFEEAVLEMDS